MIQEHTKPIFDQVLQFNNKFSEDLIIQQQKLLQKLQDTQQDLQIIIEAEDLDKDKLIMRYVQQIQQNQQKLAEINQKLVQIQTKIDKIEQRHQKIQMKIQQKEQILNEKIKQQEILQSKNDTIQNDLEQK